MLANWNETLKKILVVCLVAQDMAFPGVRWTAGRPPQALLAMLLWVDGVGERRGLTPQDQADQGVHCHWF